MAVESPFPTPGQDPWTSIVQWAEEVEQTTNATEQTVNEGRLSPDQLSATIGERVGVVVPPAVIEALGADETIQAALLSGAAAAVEAEISGRDILTGKEADGTFMVPPAVAAASVPAVGTTLMSYGLDDGITFSGATAVETEPTWITGVASAMGYSWPGANMSNRRGRQGVRLEDVATRIVGTVNPYAPGSAGLVVVDGLRNSIGLHGSTTTGLSGARESLKAILAALGAASRLEQTDPDFVYTGTWSNQSVNAFSGGSRKYTSMTGAYAQFTAPSGDAYLVMDGKQGDGPTIEISDQTAGTVLATLDLSAIISPSPDTPTFIPYVWRIPASAYGHNVRVTRTGGTASMTIDALMIQSPTPPTVLLMKQPYLTDYAAVPGFPSGSDEAVDAFNQIIDQVAVAFPFVRVVDPNAAGWNPAQHVASNGYSYTVEGREFLAEAAMSTLYGATIGVPAIGGFAVTRDASGRILSVDEDGITSSISRDADGRLAAFSVAQRTVSISRDSSGRIEGAQ